MTSQSTHVAVSDETLSKLQDLVRINIDSQDGFAKAAESIKHAETKALFRELGAERGRFARQLAEVISYNHEKPKDDGCFLAQMHRWWIGLKGSVTDGDLHAILVEAERGEDKIKAMYDEVTSETLRSPVHGVVVEQSAAVRAAHDRIRNLRDATA